MFGKAVKKWTILIYADGNNEMESIMYKSLLACEKVGSNKDVNVVYQIGRLGSYNDSNSDTWSGVRRYYVNKNNLNLVEDIGKSNMADPNSLYDFIKWGIENYKSEHYMVVLSDHGGDFIGCFTDESLDKPYIMGIPEMIKAVNAIKKNLGYEIDILVLDMCYMNSIEVIYEISHEYETAVKSAIMYMDYAAYDGINYDKLVYFTEKYSQEKDLKLFIKNVIDKLDFDLMAFEINHDKLEKIKKIFHDASSLYLMKKNSENPLESVNKAIITEEQTGFIKNINELLSSLLIYSKKDFGGLNISIKVTSKDIGQLISFYKKLAFSRDNYWTDFLSSIPFSNQSRNIDRINVALNSYSTPVAHHILNFNS